MEIERKFKTKNPTEWVKMALEEATDEICAYVFDGIETGNGFKFSNIERHRYLLWVAYDIGFHHKYETAEALYRPFQFEGEIS